MSEVEVMKTHDQLRYVSILVAAVCGLIVLMISGCMVGPDYHPPQPTQFPPLGSA